METQTRITTDTINGMPLIKVCGDFDYFSKDKFRRTVRTLTQEDCRDIVVDMSEVDFLDSGGMSGLVYALKLLSAKQGCLWLATCNDHIMRKMQIAGLHRLAGMLNFVQTVDSALSAIGKGSTAL